MDEATAKRYRSRCKGSLTRIPKRRLGKEDFALRANIKNIRVLNDTYEETIPLKLATIERDLKQMKIIQDILDKNMFGDYKSIKSAILTEESHLQNERRMFETMMSSNLELEIENPLGGKRHLSIMFENPQRRRETEDRLIKARSIGEKRKNKYSSENFHNFQIPKFERRGRSKSEPYVTQTKQSELKKIAHSDTTSSTRKLSLQPGAIIDTMKKTFWKDPADIPENPPMTLEDSLTANQNKGKERDSCQVRKKAWSKSEIHAPETTDDRNHSHLEGSGKCSSKSRAVLARGTSEATIASGWVPTFLEELRDPANRDIDKY